jgi:YVTN family beta-propeller protein
MVGAVGSIRHPRARTMSGGLRAARLTVAVCAVVLACGIGTGFADGAAPSIYVANEAAGTVSVIDAETDTVVGPAIAVGSLPQAVAISPDGATAYVTNQGSGTVSVIDTATAQVTATITVGLKADSIPAGAAISPDGSTLYVTYGFRPGTEIGPGEVAVISTSTGVVTNRIEVGEEPTGIAVTPEGSKAYVADFGSGQITPITWLGGANPRAQPPVDVGGTPSGVAVTPDGKTVYVTNGSADEVSVLDAATGALTTTLTDPSFDGPQGVAISPGGDGAYVADFEAGRLSALGASGQVLGTVGVAATPFGVAYAPDGKTVYVSSSGAPGSVTAIDTESRTVIGGPVAVDDDPLGLAISPDQAPVAALEVSTKAAGNPTAFDASGSSVRYGQIVSYAWNFGDGTTSTTSTPTTTHIYSAPGLYKATVTETDSAGTSTARVFTGQTISRNGGPSATAEHAVAIVAARPAATPSTNALEFGDQTMSQLYLTKPVTLTDTGEGPLHVSGVAVTGPNLRSFAVDDDHCSGQTVAPGASCVVEVRFLPTSVGAKAATLQFTDDAVTSPQSVALSGVGLSPVIAFAPASLGFADQAPGTSSEPKGLTVTNMGNEALQVSHVTLAGKNPDQFTVLGDTCTAAAVEPGHSCTVSVEFGPTAFGFQNALVEIEDDAPGSPHAVQVTGSGVGGEAALSPSLLSFADQTVGTAGPAEAAQVMNVGNAPLHISHPVIAGAGAGAFKLEGDGCSGQTVEPGSGCSLEIAFAPTAVGAFGARLSLMDDGVGVAPTVELEGSGLADSVTPPPPPDQQPGDQSSAGGGPPSPPPPAEAGATLPRVSTRAARQLGPRRSRLSGAVDPAGTSTRYRFEWGLTRKYGRRTPWRSAGAANRLRPVAVAIRGLRPGTTYHYRLVAGNDAGTALGHDRVFRTRAPH